MASPSTRRRGRSRTQVAEEAMVSARAAVDEGYTRGVRRGLRNQALERARDAARIGKERRRARYAGLIPKYYEALDECSKTIVNQALTVTGGNKTAAAEALGMTPRGLDKVIARKSRSTRKGAGRRTDLE